MPDPRVKPLFEAAIQSTDINAYYPQYATVAERARMETVLWLARYDALCRYYEEHGVPAPEKSEPEKPDDADDTTRVMRAILASVPDGVVGVEHATIFARAALAEIYGPAPEKSEWKVDATRDLIESPRPLLPDCMMPDGAEPCAGYQQLRMDADRLAEKLREAGEPLKTRFVGDKYSVVVPTSEALSEPIPMILFCPACDVQHIDAAEPHKEDCETLIAVGDSVSCTCDRWTNPPHRSHKCANCGEVWRPADVATIGVHEIETKGSADSLPPIRGQTGKMRFRK